MTWVTKKATDLKAGDVVQLDEDDIATLETAPLLAPYPNDHYLIAWCVGDKLPVYFWTDEKLPVEVDDK